MTRIVRTGAALCGATLALLAPAAAQAMPGPGVVVRWNSFLLDLQGAPGHQPATVHPTYELAVMHKAIGDAVAGEASSDEAAVDAAAHDTLGALYPASASAIDDRYAGELDQLPPGRRRDRGLLSGRRAAARTLAGRAGHGSGAAPIPFSPDATPGAYQLTPPAFAPPVFTHWSHVRPFVLRRADQF